MKFGSHERNFKSKETNFFQNYVSYRSLSKYKIKKATVYMYIYIYIYEHTLK